MASDRLALSLLLLITLSSFFSSSLSLTASNGSKGALDLSCGSSTVAASGGGLDKQTKKKNIHGVLNAISWGILFPFGAIISRYLKHPASHISCQILAYALGVAGCATGLKLGSESSGIVYTIHRYIGIALFCFATIQVFTLLLRPKKDHKYRYCWNIYHHGLGYAIIILGIVNVFEGLRILHPEQKWKSRYIIILIVLGAISVLLEAITRAAVVIGQMFIEASLEIMIEAGKEKLESWNEMVMVEGVKEKSESLIKNLIEMVEGRKEKSEFETAMMEGGKEKSESLIKSLNELFMMDGGEEKIKSLIKSLTEGGKEILETLIESLNEMVMIEGGTEKFESLVKSLMEGGKEKLEILIESLNEMVMNKGGKEKLKSLIKNLIEGLIEGGKEKSE